MTNGFPFRRIAITVPPRSSFHGVTFAFFASYRRVLIDLGFELIEVPVEAFMPPDITRIESLLADLRSFRPDLAIGLPAGTLALTCRLAARRDGSRPNLFTDVLEIPTVCIWGFAPVDFADQLLQPHPATPSESKSGALAELRRILAHPLLIHWSRDSWQSQAMRKLRLARKNRIIQFGSPALPGFDPSYAMPRPDALGDNQPQIGFIGNLYQDLPDEPDERLQALQREAIADWLAKGSTSLWDVTAARIASLPSASRRALALTHDQTFFWRFMHQLIAHRAQTAKRLQTLAAAGQPVAVYGNFKQDGRGVPANARPMAERFSFGPELAAAYARHPITLHVTNPGFVHGFSYNPVLTFAVGGFALVDRKRDFVDTFGELGEAVSYRDDAELAAKIDMFLGKPTLRCSVSGALQAEIMRHHTLANALQRALGETGNTLQGFVADRPKATVSVHGDLRIHQDVLARLQTHTHWHDARCERDAGAAIITTSSQAWAYAAEIPLAALPSNLIDPSLRLQMVVERGRIGICLVHSETGEILSEQVLGVTRFPVTATVELPRTIPVSVIFRNTVSERSRAVLNQAHVCTRGTRSLISRSFRRHW